MSKNENQIEKLEFCVVDDNLIDSCIELTKKAFFPYEYFSYYFEDENKRKELLDIGIDVEYKVNKKVAICFGCMINKKIVAVAVLYKNAAMKASIFKYIKAGITKLIGKVNLYDLISWMMMENSAIKPCLTQKKDSCYLEILAVDPKHQHKHIGTRLIKEEVIPYLKRNGVSKLCLYTNSEVNRRFYKSCDFIEFDKREFKHNNKILKSWSFYKDI